MKSKINKIYKKGKKYLMKALKIIVLFGKQNIFFLVFVITSVMNSTLLRFLTVHNYTKVMPITADFAIMFLVASLGFYIKPKRRPIYYISWSIFVTALCIINSMYYTNYLSFSSISLITTAFFIVDVADAVTENIMELKDFSYLWQPLTMLFFYYYLKKKKYFTNSQKNDWGKKGARTSAACGVLLAGLFILCMKPVDYSRIIKQYNREFLLSRFGLYTYHINDLIQSVQPQINSLFGYDQKAKMVRDYYSDRNSPKKENEYTNIFEGKNIIVIHAESIQKFAMSLKFNGLEVTPNLNRLAKEGMFFTNFYAQESVGTSSDSEYTLNTSLLPVSNGTIFVSYWNREFVSIPKLLKEKGYYTFSMHGNTSSFWNRALMYKEFGYDRFYSKEDYEIDDIIGLGLADKSFFKQSIPKIKEIQENNQNFYGTMLMLSNHTPFDSIRKYGNFPVTYNYQRYNEETGLMEAVTSPYLEDTKVGNYLKSVHYADEAIGQFILQLDEAGLLENTVLVIYGDHDAKIKKKDFEIFYNYDPYTDSVLDKDDENYREVTYYDYELNRKVPFIIWTKDKEFNIEVDEVMGMYDVLPTLGNMFNFESSYQLGHDIFNVEENIVVFPNSNWLTNKMYYNNQKDEFLALTSDPIDSNYIAKNKKYAEEILDVSNSVILYDLIRKNREKQEGIENYEGDIK